MEHPVNDIEYKQGSGDEFTHFLFSTEPKQKGSIQLVFDPQSDLPMNLHIFQELLMIFTDGMKYLFGIGDQRRVSIQTLSTDDISMLNKYLESVGFMAQVDIVTSYDYLDNMIYPNYFLNKELIAHTTTLDEFYFETHLQGSIYRLSFNYIL